MLLLAPLVFADVIYQNGSKAFGEIIEINSKYILITKGCNRSNQIAVPLRNIKYVIFNNRCDATSVKPSFGGGNEEGCDTGTLRTYYIAKFKSGEGILCSEVSLNMEGTFSFTFEQNKKHYSINKAMLSELRMIKLCKNSSMYKNLLAMSQIPK